VVPIVDVDPAPTNPATAGRLLGLVVTVAGFLFAV